MSYASSMLSTSGTLAVYGRKITQNGKPDVEIILDDHVDGKTYTTFDSLSGKVNITAPHAARFDEIRITLEGTTKTFVESLAPTSTRSRLTAVHNFLKLVMPIRDSEYPTPRIAEAGRTYTFPFNFVIPDRLLPRACSHETSADHVHDAHLELPPSMGECLVALRDDLAPEMSKIQYAIKVKVIRTRERDGKAVVLVDGAKKFRVVPAVAEAPPLSIGDGFDSYVLTKAKTLRKGMFSGKLGTITVTAAQTGALVLPAPSDNSKTSATTKATIHLRFDPHTESSEPPRLGGLTTRLGSTTFYAARPTSQFPTYFNMTSHYETTRGIYNTSIPLSSRCVESVAWTKQHQVQRRNSDSSASSSDCSDDCQRKERKGVFYTASMVVPVTLPTSKAFVPTFHSCIVSRIYTLDFALTIHTPGTAIPASTVSLHLPVQIASTANTTERARLTPAEAAAELADVNEFFLPRLIEMPREDWIGNSTISGDHGSSDLPPSYEDFAGPRIAIESGR